MERDSVRLVLLGKRGTEVLCHTSMDNRSHKATIGNCVDKSAFALHSPN